MIKMTLKLIVPYHDFWVTVDMATNIVMRSFVNCLFVGQIATTFYNEVKM